MFYPIVIIGFISLLSLTACSPGSKSSTAPNVTEALSEYLSEPYAKIAAIEVLKGGNFPLQYSASVTVNFDGQCKKIREITQDFENATFKIDIFTEAQSACPTPLGTMEQIIPLDIINLPAGVYKVVVNGVNKNFELPVDNKL